MSKIKIGTCGYGYYDPGEGWKEKYESKLQAYTDEFDTGEINKTFYKLPMEKTAKKWKNNALEDFTFNFKAWQALTHPTSSPTWRNKKDKLSESQKENFGYLRPNEDVVEAWEESKKIGMAMEADVCVIQTPGSFDCSKENEENMRELFRNISIGDLNIAWEPRGDWKDNEKTVEEICDDLDLIHVVDLMQDDPVSDHEIAYTRLHGLNENEYDYNYDYTEKELDKLKDLAAKKSKVYCMFNNYEMFDNAQKLKEKIMKGF